MRIRNTTARWGAFSQFLHWLIVALIVTQVILANMALDLPVGVRKLAMFARHKSVGLTILALAVIRLAWRWMNPTPTLPDTLRPYERTLAHFTHAALYLLLFAMPLTGWMMTSARGFPVSWFGFFQLPDFVPKNKMLYETMRETHDTLALILYAVVFLHVAAALKHHFMLKDDVLRRMLPSIIVAAGLLFTSAVAGAAPLPYLLDPARSALEYQFVQAGARNKGRFTKFSVTLALAPDALAQSKLDVTVQMTSLDTGDKERDDTLRSADLFDVAKYPQAQFVSTQISSNGSGYDAVGKLTIRGVTRDAHVPFTFRTTSEQGKPVGYLTGKLVIRRLDFGIGQGDWKSTEWVGNEVTVSYSLRLAAAR